MSRYLEARGALKETLDHWKDNTRPGDERITTGDVVAAIDELVQAALEQQRERAEYFEHTDEADRIQRLRKAAQP
jgi:delta 1-pyrroline-5-carboxylate dehydrogenase